MAKALIIKGANFTDNKVRTIALSDPIDCTGIALNKSTISITDVGNTETLSATVTPVDTTDTVVWTSSDEDVATVSGGVVTALKIGTATITATCGKYSASCAVSVSQIADVKFVINMYCAKDDNKDFLAGGTLNNYAVGYSESGTKYISYGISGKYPVLIPDGANKIEITCAGFRPYGFWVNSKIGGAMVNNAFAYEKDDNFVIDSDINDFRLVTIPDRTSGTYEGMDAVAFVVRYPNGTITQEVADTISVKFTA